jgi:hypothetical protein
VKHCTVFSIANLISFQQVDINEVANDAGYKNPHSVSNRLTQMKDRYGLKISGSTKVRSESQLDNSEIDEFKEALAIASPENPAIKTGVGRKHSAKGETGRKSATKKVNIYPKRSCGICNP